MRIPNGFNADQFPLLFAHRGIQTAYPENTMAAFMACQQFNIPGIELDVHLTTDGYLVVFHDETLARIASRPDRIDKSTWSYLKHIDIGSSFAPRFSQERIPLLADVLDCLGDDIYFDIELKNKSSHDNGLSAAVAKTLQSVKPKAPVIVSSFNPLELRRFKAIRPDIATAAIYCLDKELPWYLRSGLGKRIGKADGYKPEIAIAPRKLSNNRNAKAWVLPWTVNSAQEAAALLKSGAVGLISDDPRELLQTAHDFLSSRLT